MYIISCSTDRIVRVWSLVGKQCVQEIKLGDSVYIPLCAAFSPSMEIVPVGCYLDVLLIYKRDKDELFKFHQIIAKGINSFPSNHIGQVSLIALAFSRDNSLLAASSNDGSLRLWSIQNGAKLQEKNFTVKVPSGFFSAVCFSPDSKFLLTVSDDQIIRIWQLSDINKPFREVKPKEGYLFSISSTDFSLKEFHPIIAENYRSLVGIENYRNFALQRRISSLEHFFSASAIKGTTDLASPVLKTILEEARADKGN